MALVVTNPLFPDEFWLLSAEHEIMGEGFLEPIAIASSFENAVLLLNQSLDSGYQDYESFLGFFVVNYTLDNIDVLSTINPLCFARFDGDGCFIPETSRL